MGEVANATTTGCEFRLSLSEKEKGLPNLQG